MFTSFIGKVLSLLAKYLPLNDKVINLLDFVELRGEFIHNEDKILKFNNLFQVIKKPEEIENLKQELTRIHGLSPADYRRDAKNSIHMWDLVEKDNFTYLPIVAKFAQTFPTSSATIEQTFSILKLIKGEKRYNLSEKNLEGQIYIHQEFNGTNSIHIPDEIVDLYYIMKGEINYRKSSQREDVDVRPVEQQNEAMDQEFDIL